MLLIRNHNPQNTRKMNAKVSVFKSLLHASLPQCLAIENTLNSRSEPTGKRAHTLGTVKYHIGNFCDAAVASYGIYGVLLPLPVTSLYAHVVHSHTPYRISCAMRWVHLETYKIRRYLLTMTKHASVFRLLTPVNLRYCQRAHREYIP